MERAAVKARFTLDALILINYERVFDFAGDSAYRADLGAFGTALTERGIDTDLHELLAAAGRTSTVYMCLIFVSEVL